MTYNGTKMYSVEVSVEMALKYIYLTINSHIAEHFHYISKEINRRCCEMTYKDVLNAYLSW